MSANPQPTYTAFDGHRIMATGALGEVALAVQRALEAGARGSALIYSDHDGRLMDVDLRGTESQILERLQALSPTVDAADSADQKPASAASAAPLPARGRGRPRLGVVAREVTLLPRHWEWLAAQPGGASVALRKLVEAARRSHEGEDRRRQATDAAYRFMVSIAGDLPEFEAASRALFAHDLAAFGDCIAAWPRDVADYAMKLARAGTADVGMAAHTPGAAPEPPAHHLRTL